MITNGLMLCTIKQRAALTPAEAHRPVSLAPEDVFSMQLQSHPTENNRLYY